LTNHRASNRSLLALARAHITEPVTPDILRFGLRLADGIRRRDSAFGREATVQMHTVLLLVVGVVLLIVACSKKDAAAARQLKQVGWWMVAVALLVPIALILVLMVLSLLDKHAAH
jgi:hypothetical protein